MPTKQPNASQRRYDALRKNLGFLWSFTERFQQTNTDENHSKHFDVGITKIEIAGTSEQTYIRLRIVND